MGTQLKTRAILSKSMEEREPFERGNLRGKRYESDEFIPTGQLPQEHREALISIRDATIYVVYSFLTPIAWIDTCLDEWVIPDVRYSVTTTHHQSLVRVEAANPGFYARMY